MILPRHVVERNRRLFPPGTRVELVSMNDPYTKLKRGDRGTITAIDDIGTVHVNWDSGSTLGLVYGEDTWKILKEDTLGKED